MCELLPAACPVLTAAVTWRDVAAAVAKDSTLVCRVIAAALPDTLDHRAINTKRLELRDKVLENHTLALKTAQSIGCDVRVITEAALAAGEEAPLRLFLKQLKPAMERAGREAGARLATSRPASRSGSRASSRPPSTYGSPSKVAVGPIPEGVVVAAAGNSGENRGGGGNGDDGSNNESIADVSNGSSFGSMKLRAVAGNRAGDGRRMSMPVSVSSPALQSMAAQGGGNASGTNSPFGGVKLRPAGNRQGSAGSGPPDTASVPMRAKTGGGAQQHRRLSMPAFGGGASSFGGGGTPKTKTGQSALLGWCQQQADGYAVCPLPSPQNAVLGLVLHRFIVTSARLEIVTSTGASRPISPPSLQWRDVSCPCLGHLIAGQHLCSLLARCWLSQTQACMN